MGRRTLAEFREDLQAVEGLRGQSNRWLDRRVNSGYIEVATPRQIMHEELTQRVSLSTVADQEAYVVADELIGIEQVMILDDLTTPLDGARYLAFTEDIDQYRREGELGSDGGRPKVWTLEARNLRLRPVPDDVYQLEYLAYNEPLPLALDSDVTDLDWRWDQAVHLMAAHYALMDLGQGERAEQYFTRARLYMDTRIKDGDERRSAHHVPMANPKDFRELVRARKVP